MKHHAKAPSAGSTEAKTTRRLGRLLAILALALCALASSASPASAATATMGTVTKVFSTTAHVTGDIGSPAGTTLWRFDVSTDGGANWSLPEGGLFNEYGSEPSTPTTVEADLRGLTPGTEYLVRFATVDLGNEGEETLSTSVSFTTAPQITDPPTVLATDDASEVSYTSAKATGEVERPAGEDPALDPACQFEYITDAAYIANPVGERFSGATPVACDHNPLKAADGTEVEAVLTGLSPATTYHLRLLASNAAGTDSLESADTFTTQTVTAPTVAIDPVTSFEATTAHLTGKVDPNGTDPAFDASWHFECTPACGEPGGTVPAGPEQTVQADVNELEPNTAYEVKLVASNLGGPGEAGPVSFTTSTQAPTVQAGFATDVNASSATLTAKVNPHNSEVTYQFEYGTDESYGTTIPVPAADLNQVDNVNHAVAETIEGLAADTTYHFRLVATNTESEETTHGTDREFTTQTASGPKVCPNEQLRAENNSLKLPDCRAYEQVSPVKKYGNDAGAPNGKYKYAYAMADGSGIFFGTRGPQGDVLTGGLQEYGVARRGTAGWRTVSAIPSTPALHAFVGGHQPVEVVPSADLSSLLFSALGSFVPDNPETGGAQLSNALNLAHLGGSVEWLTRPQIPNPVPAPGNIGGGAFQPLGGTPDLGTVYFSSGPTLLPGDEARVSGLGLYEYSEGTLKSAGTLPPSPGNPDGSPDPAGALPASTNFSTSLNFLSAEAFGNQVSRDGSTLWFVSRDSAAGIDMPQLYLRRGGHSTLVSHTPDGSPAPSGVSAVITLNGLSFADATAKQFAFASADGSSAVFQSTDALTENAPSDGFLKSYRYEVGTDTVTYLPGVNGATVVAASDDGSRFMFGDALHTRIGVWDDGAVRTIWNEGSSTSLQAAPARATASGSVFVFSTGAPIDANSGGPVQVYRYDLAHDHTECLSCPADGVASEAAILANQTEPGEGPLLAPRAMSADGRRVFFQTATALVPEDINGVSDVYEWTPGGVFLISSGQDEKDSILLDISADGSDAFFATAEGLDPRDTDSSYDVYDARVGGGFAQVPAIADCSANEVCKKASPPPPNRPSPATNSFSGPGNPAPCPKGKVRKHGRCVKQKPKKHKHHKKAHKKNKRTVGHSRGGSK